MAGALGLGRGMSFPPRVGGDGRIACSADDVNIAEAIEIIVKTDLGERLALPEFGAGLQEFLFEPNTTTTRRQISGRITAAVTRWEPRVLVESVAVDAAPGDPLAVVASIHYRLVATDRQHRIDLSMRLGS